ncbi:MAG TPA: serine hydrolase domain-containing protein [Bacteroidota bacterium]
MVLRFFIRVTIFSTLVLSPLLLLGQETARDRGRAFATELLTSAKLPGFAVAVSVGDSIVWSEGFGFADVERREPVTPSTRFRIGSVTKLLTAIAAAQLYERGVLDLDSPVQRYVPSFPDKGSTVSTRQLLGHLSGIRHYGRSEFISRVRYSSVEEALGVFKNDSLLFTPGTKYFYSSYGYVLASAVIEKASGLDFLRYLSKEVINRLGMASTVPDYNDPRINQATPYSFDASNNVALDTTFNDNSIRWAAGGFLSTANDLTLLGSSLLKDGVLKPETRRLLVTSQKTSDGKETGVGLGWRIGTDSLGHRFFHHAGVSLGGRAVVMVYPDSKVVVALLTNLSFARIGEKEALLLATMFSK